MASYVDLTILKKLSVLS